MNPELLDLEIGDFFSNDFVGGLWYRFVDSLQEDLREGLVDSLVGSIVARLEDNLWGSFNNDRRGLLAIGLI